MTDSIICNVHTQYEFTHIPTEFNMQNLEDFSNLELE